MNVRTASFVFWLVISIVMIVTMPNLDTLVREKGQVEMPDYVQSTNANELLTKMETGGNENYQFIAVFTSSEKLTNEQKQEIDESIEALREKKEELGITNILAYNESKETEKQLVAKDGTTILIQITVDQNAGTVEEVAKRLRKVLDTKTVDTYFTGTDLVLDDFSKSSQEGIKKTEIIAVIFILIVLVIVFRSPVVPFVSLLTVGIAYIISLGIVAQIVEHFDFPFSNFTQVFLIVVLFGIGTDYNILLYNRFKEEVQGRPILKAITETYRTAGKTVVYSGVAVLIGFVALYLAEFKLYRATSAVAIGVAVLLLVLISLNPFFMATFGFKLFWPAKKVKGHQESKLWGLLSKFSLFRPIFALTIIAVICIPFIYVNSGELNYNDLVEINDKYESKQAIQVIEKHFPAGFSAPTNLVIQSDESLATQKALQDIDQLVEAISKVDGVSEVYSVTRPGGEKIKELYVQDQMDTLTGGLGTAEEGITEINEGLSEAEKELGKVDQEKFDNIQQLIDGTKEMEQGVGQLNDALERLSQGLKDGAVGAQTIRDGLTSLQQNISQLSQGARVLRDSYGQLEQAFSSFSVVFSTIIQSIEQSYNSYSSIEKSLMASIEANPELNSDEHITEAIQMTRQGIAQLDALLEQLEPITSQYNQALQSLQVANSSMAQITEGLKRMETGVTELESGASNLVNGLYSGAEGASTIQENSRQLQSGLVRVNEGQKQLQQGLTTLQEKMNLLQSGLAQSSGGLSQINEGLAEAQDYLKELTDTSGEIFYIPQEVLEGEEFKKSLNMYMSEDRHITKMTIILDANPYSKEAMSIIEEIDEQVQAIAKGLSFNHGKIVLGGKSAQNVDLENVSTGDFAKTITIMLVGIALVLLIITRSFWKMLLIIGSLIIAYFTALGIAELLSEYTLGQSQFSWNVPFFSFIMIITLGVDYSIFLMMRYFENIEKGHVAIIDASKQIGGVVLSAAIILGGTFAALLPSGIVTLMQVAIIVVVGLILLSLMMLPVFIPAVIGLTYKIKMFFKKNKNKGASS